MEFDSFARAGRENERADVVAWLGSLAQWNEVASDHAAGSEIARLRNVAARLRLLASAVERGEHVGAASAAAAGRFSVGDWVTRAGGSAVWVVIAVDARRGRLMISNSALDVDEVDASSATMAPKGDAQSK